MKTIPALALFLSLFAVMNIQAEPEPPSFALGASLEDVILSAGAPSNAKQFKTINEVLLIYGNSYIRFRNDRVFRWMNSGDLNHVTDRVSERALITKGSSKRDVIAIHDRPDRTKTYKNTGVEILYYGDSYLSLKHDQVTDWLNEGNLNVHSGDSTDLNALFVLKDEVIDEQQRLEQEASSLRFKTGGRQIEVPSAWGSRPFTPPTLSSSSSSSSRSERTTSRSSNQQGSSNNYNSRNSSRSGSSSSYNNNSYNSNNSNRNNYNRNNNSSYNRNSQLR